MLSTRKVVGSVILLSVFTMMVVASHRSAMSRLLTPAEMRMIARGGDPGGGNDPCLQGYKAFWCGDHNGDCGGYITQPTCDASNKDCVACTSTLTVHTKCSYDKPYMYIGCTETTVAGGCGTKQGGTTKCGWIWTYSTCFCTGGNVTTNACDRIDVGGDTDCKYQPK
jgi:hypothetical protein